MQTDQGEAERDARIAELEARLAKPPASGVTPIVAGLALVLCAGVLSQLWLDAEYFFSVREPINAGAEGDYRFEGLQNNRYVELHGIPTSRAGFGVDGAQTVVAVGVRDTPIMLWRKAVRGEEWTPGTKPPPPNQQPFTVRGRLLARASAPEKYHEAFATLDRHAEVAAKWVLIEGARPGTDFVSSALTALVAGLAGFSAWLLLRWLRGLVRR